MLWKTSNVLAAAAIASLKGWQLGFVADAVQVAFWDRGDKVPEGWDEELVSVSFGFPAVLLDCTNTICLHANFALGISNVDLIALVVAIYSLIFLAVKMNIVTVSVRRSGMRGSILRVLQISNLIRTFLQAAYTMTMT